MEVGRRGQGLALDIIDSRVKGELRAVLPTSTRVVLLLRAKEHYLPVRQVTRPHGCERVLYRRPRTEHFFENEATHAMQLAQSSATLPWVEARRRTIEGKFVIFNASTAFLDIHSFSNSFSRMTAAATLAASLSQKSISNKRN